MTNDDSRGLESPDRPHALTPNDRVACDGGTTDESVRERLETITRLTNSILEEIQNPDTTSDLEDVSEATRRETTRRLREIDAEAMRVGLELVGPGMILPESDDADPPTVVGCDSLTTTYSGPAPGTVEHVSENADPDSVAEILETEADDSDCEGDRDGE